MSMSELHPTQIGILNKLLFATQLRHSELKFDPTIENNTFKFHLDKVIKDGYVQKNEKGYYSLTVEGKKLATHIDTDKNTIVGRRKVSVHLYCLKENAGSYFTLFYTRLKHPFYGKQGFPAGKVQEGEKFQDAAKRELKEETNLTGNPVLFHISHYLVKDKTTNNLLDDKIFLDFFIKNPEGDLMGSNEGDYKWIPTNDLRKYILNPFDTVEVYETAFARIEKYDGSVGFEELEQLTSDF